jgi:hypothetical protein
MEQELQAAKLLISKEKPASIDELVLSEIIKLNGTATRHLCIAITQKLGISEALFRKSVHNLKKLNLLMKVGVTIYINPEKVKGNGRQR